MCLPHHNRIGVPTIFATKTKTNGATAPVNTGTHYGDLSLPYIPTPDEYSPDLVAAKKELAKLIAEAKKLTAVYRKAEAAANEDRSTSHQLTPDVIAAMAREEKALRAKARVAEGAYKDARAKAGVQNKVVTDLELKVQREIQAAISTPFINHLRRVATIRHLERTAQTTWPSLG